MLPRARHMRNNVDSAPEQPQHREKRQIQEAAILHNHRRGSRKTCSSGAAEPSKIGRNKPLLDVRFGSMELHISE